MKNNNMTTFKWFWPNANKTFEIEYNSKLFCQAQLLTKIYTAGSFDNFKSWAKKNNIIITVYNGFVA